MADKISNAVTCLRPTDGGLHFGHYIGNVQPLIMHQSTYNCFFLFADLQSENYENRTVPTNNIFEMMKQILSLGVDANEVYFARESQIKINRLKEFAYLSNFVTNSRINRLPVFKNEKSPIKMSQYLFPVFQLLDFAITDATYAFSNVDNKPIIELANEVFSKSNAKFGTNYKHISLIHGTVEALIGTDGFKMSKKRRNCIFLKSSTAEIVKRVNLLYTDPNRIHSDVPGTIKNNDAFKFLRAFTKIDDYKMLADLYENGQMSDKQLKTYISEKLILIANLAQSCNYSSDKLMGILERGENILNNR